MTQALGSALITGGARRIGAACCRLLHATGFDILVHYNKSSESAEQLVNELNAQRPDSAHALACKLDDAQALQVFATGIADKTPDLKILVNNASSFFPSRFESTDRDQWADLHGTNLEAPYFLTQELTYTLKRNLGAVINIVDIHAERPLRNYSAYCASKAGLLSVTRSLALELAPEIRVNAVAPGAILWPQSNEDEFGDHAKQTILQKIPLGQLGEADDIAKAVRFLAVDAPYVTGEVIHVDGGRRLNC